MLERLRLFLDHPDMQAVVRSIGAEGKFLMLIVFPLYQFL